MNAYHIALFFHLFALLAATVASTLTHFGEHRMQRAATVGEARPWLLLVAGVGKVFPLALLTLLATGSYMVHGGWTWNLGWVDAGLVGVVVLFVSGLALERHGRGIGAELARLGDGPLDARAAAAVRDPVAAAQSWANSMLALAVVFDMATKPALPVALTVLAIGVLAGVGIARRAARPTGTHATVAGHRSIDEAVDVLMNS